MRKLVVCLTAALALIGSTSAGSAIVKTVGDPGKAWAPPNDYQRGLHVLEFIDSFPGETPSFLVDNELQKNKMVDPTCKSVTDQRCSSTHLQYAANLEVCKSLADKYCVDSFGVVNMDGTRTAATYNRNFPNKSENEYQAAPELKLPFGTTGSLFELPQAKHDGGSLYYVSAYTEGDVNKVSGASLDRFSIRIFPVSLIPDRAILISEGKDVGILQNTNPASGGVVGSWGFSGFGFSGDSFCVAGSAKEGLCAQRYGFPADVKFYVTVRTQVRPSGWTHGRIFQPDMTISDKKDYFLIDVAAFPVAVPVVYKTYSYVSMPEELKNQYDVKSGAYKGEGPQPPGTCVGGRSGCNEDPLQRNTMILPSPSSKTGMEQLKLWLPYVNDTATALLGTWTLRTLNSNETEGADKCFTNSTNGVTGIVTTNATQYSGGPPTFNKATGALEYSVSAPHYTPQNEEFTGTYDLLMRSDVARCVYGFSSAPIRASLSIVDDKGNAKVATETLKESNGWLSLSATGFTYSSPTVRVKLEQDAAPVVKAAEVKPAEVKPAQPKSPVTSKYSIYCSKGKSLKKVTGTNPKRPKGYKLNK